MQRMHTQTVYCGAMNGE